MCGGLAVTTGDGVRSLFEGLGLRTLDGGPKHNPSTYEVLAAIHAVPSEQVVVLPNSPNVVMAAERAAALADKVVRVVDSRAPQAGLAAAVSLDPQRSAQQNATAMAEVLVAAAQRLGLSPVVEPVRGGPAVALCHPADVRWLLAEAGAPDAARLWRISV